MTLTVMTFVPTELYVAVARLPVVVAEGGFASLPKFHSYRRIVDVAPDTVAVKMTVSSLAGFEFDAVMMTPGGCCGRIVTIVATVSVKPLESVAVAAALNEPAST